MAAGKICRKFAGTRETTGIRAAMAFHRYAAEAQQDTAIHVARVHLRPQGLQARHGQCRADFCHQAGRKGLAHAAAQHAGNALASLQRHIASEAIGHHHVNGALGNIIAFNKAAIVDIELGGAQPFVSLAHFVMALISSEPIFRMPILGFAMPSAARA